ncbi:Uncharacterised protein [Candidatus Norongarragalina meridionalis]|nr:Uncharacterised protein [Candidatus Norongarragalina meridionalis]
MQLVGMSMWVYLMLLSIGIMGILPFLIKKKHCSEMLKMAFFLALFDFAFENIGAIQGYWYSTGSAFPLLAVPIEVFIIALAAGSAYALIFPSKFEWHFAIASSLVIAAVGTFIEAMLIGAGNLHYANGWTSYQAFASYFVVFLMMARVNELLA